MLRGFILRTLSINNHLSQDIRKKRVLNQYEVTLLHIYTNRKYAA